MTNITIDEELKDLLPPLDPETYRLLSENILEHGLREPLVLWRCEEDDSGILIDGHNRYAICMEHDIPFRTTYMDFATREEVIIWIINTQVARRNLTPMQLSYFRGLHYQADKKKHGGNNRYIQQSIKSQNATLYPSSTASRLAEQYNVSRDTIIRDAKLAETLNQIGETSPDAKKKILAGEIIVNKNKLEALRVAPKEEIEAIATQIEDGTYLRRTPRNPAVASATILPEIKQLNGIIKNFASNFNSMFQELNTNGTADLKPVLRTYIDQLEDLYRNIQ